MSRCEVIWDNSSFITISHLYAIGRCLLWLILFLRWSLSLAPCAILCTRMARASSDQAVTGGLEALSYFTPELSGFCNFPPTGSFIIAIWEDYLIQYLILTRPLQITGSRFPVNIKLKKATTRASEIFSANICRGFFKKQYTIGICSIWNLQSEK